MATALFTISSGEATASIKDMLLAKRVSDGQIVNAYFEFEKNGPFRCPDCNEEVLLRSGQKRINHFAHRNPLACEYAVSESEAHLRCKLEIYQALLKEPAVRDVVVERRMGTVRPDVSAYINRVPVAIEIQMSSLSIDTIMRRTIEYFHKGIYVLWLLQWKPELDQQRYHPELWEKWVHACYFGHVYYWTEGLNVVEYSFEPALKSVPRKIWYGKNGERMAVGGYTRRLARSRTAIRGRRLNLARDFGPRMRYWWEGGGIKVPDAKLFMSNGGKAH